jgi:hypothetical protein
MHLSKYLLVHQHLLFLLWKKWWKHLRPHSNRASLRLTESLNLLSCHGASIYPHKCPHRWTTSCKTCCSDRVFGRGSAGYEFQYYNDRLLHDCRIIGWDFLNKMCISFLFLKNRFMSTRHILFFIYLSRRLK